MACIDEAIAQEVVIAAPDSKTGFAFGHELLRSVLYDALLPPERRRWHLRIAVALETRSHAGDAAPPTDLAHHFHSALPDTDLRKTVRYCRKAAARAALAAANAEWCATSGTRSRRSRARAPQPPPAHAPPVRGGAVRAEPLHHRVHPRDERAGRASRARTTTPACGVVRHPAQPTRGCSRSRATADLAARARAHRARRREPPRPGAGRPRSPRRPFTPESLTLIDQAGPRGAREWLAHGALRDAAQSSPLHGGPATTGAPWRSPTSEICSPRRTPLDADLAHRSGVFFVSRVSRAFGGQPRRAQLALGRATARARDVQHHERSGTRAARGRARARQPPRAAARLPGARRPPPPGRARGYFGHEHAWRSTGYGARRAGGPCSS